MLLNGVSPVWLPWTETGVSLACATHCCVPCCGDLPAGNSQRGSSCAGHVQHGCPVWFFLMARMPGAPPEPPHSCAHCCWNLLVLYQDKSGQADLPLVWGQAELQQGLKATGSELVLVMFSSLVFFFYPFPPDGEGNVSFFLSQFLKKSPKSVWEYLVKNNKKWTNLAW